MGDPPERAPGFLREARLSRGGDHSGSRGGREVQPARLSQKRDFGLWNDDHRSSSTYSDIAFGLWVGPAKRGVDNRFRGIGVTDMIPTTSIHDRLIYKKI